MVEIAIALELSARDASEGWKIVEAVGEIDLLAAHLLEALFQDLIADGRFRLVADLTRVDFLDSTGLAVLLRTLKKVREHEGDLVIVCSSGPVRRVLEVSGAEREIPVLDEIPREFSAHPGT